MQVAPGGRTSYSYDAAGNRTRKDRPGGEHLLRLGRAQPADAGGAGGRAGDHGLRRRRQAAEQDDAGADAALRLRLRKVLQEADADGATQKQYASTEEQYGDLLSAYGDGQRTLLRLRRAGLHRCAAGPRRLDAGPLRLPGLRPGIAHQGSDDNRMDLGGQAGLHRRPRGGPVLPASTRYYDPAAGRLLSRGSDRLRRAATPTCTATPATTRSTTPTPAAWPCDTVTAQIEPRPSDARADKGAERGLWDRPRLDSERKSPGPAHGGAPTITISSIYSPTCSRRSGCGAELPGGQGLRRRQQAPAGLGAGRPHQPGAEYGLRAQAKTGRLAGLAEAVVEVGPDLRRQLRE